jgi:hypothetical protein
MGASCFGIKVLNLALRFLCNELKQLRPALQQFLLIHSAYSPDEYFNLHWTKDLGPYTSVSEK